MGIKEAYERLLEEFGEGKPMVLSTAKDGRVTARMMSIVQIDGAFYFQTDCTFRKYDQLLSNPCAALCIDNLQIEGICKEAGRPSDCPAFSEAFSACYPGSYDRYSMLENERVFCLTPTFIERWLYIGGKPYVETMDFAGKDYRLIPYMD